MYIVISELNFPDLKEVQRGFRGRAVQLGASSVGEGARGKAEAVSCRSAVRGASSEPADSCTEVLSAEITWLSGDIV